MFRVWICLAVSMTGGSTLLTWLEPDQSAATGTPATDHERAALLAVSDRGTPARTWTGVTLVSLTGGRSGMLAARSGREDVHFMVHEDGNIVPYPAWRRQEMIEENGDIRVAIQSTGQEAPIDGRQAGGVRALLRALARLQSASDPALGPMPVRVDEADSELPVQHLGQGILSGLPMAG